jgi:hypothetical protein
VLAVAARFRGFGVCLRDFILLGQTVGDGDDLLPGGILVCSYMDERSETETIFFLGESGRCYFAYWKAVVCGLMLS